MPDQEKNSLVHCVYFTLKDRSDAARDALVDSCHKYLNGHPGTIFFRAGTPAAAYQRAVNDVAFDVALVIVFATAKDHNAYQVSERHQRFLAEQLPNCAQVRVFDSLA
jgi:hypothetical protein